MFRKQPKQVCSIIDESLRENGLETPLLQYRIINQFESLLSKEASQYIGEKTIKNQILFVKIKRPSLRNDLSMMRHDLVNRLNEAVGHFVISDIRFY